MILTDEEKKADWDDPKKLKETITMVAIQKNRAEKGEKHFREQRDEARRTLADAEARMKIAENKMNEAEQLGLELTRRLMELEEGKTYV
jgi:hypothetical protein